jgi:hypothetical protein
MTRGRPSLQAIEEGAGIAAKRGIVIEINPHKKSPMDLYVIRSNDIIAIKIKRVRSRIREPKDLTFMFKDGITEIRTLPLPPLVQREIWTLAPWGTWQFFLILDTWIIELSSDGAPVQSTQQNPEKPVAPGSPPGLLTEIPHSLTPRQGFLCPFYAQARE